MKLTGRLSLLPIFILLFILSPPSLLFDSLRSPQARSDFAEATKTIIDVLSSDERFTKLIQSLQRTQLIYYVNHLKSVTFFAPVNEAFENPFITKETMLYHICQQEIKGEELYDGQLLTTLYKISDKLGEGEIGQKERVDFSDGDEREIYIGNAKILEKNLQADNGIIHVIDKVLEVPMDALTTLSSLDQLRLFVKYLRMTRLSDHIENGNHITVFVPTNDAINHQFKSYEKEYFVGECGGGLRDLDLLAKHQLHSDNVIYSSSIERGSSKIETEQGEPLDVERDEGNNIRVANGLITLKDLLAENGVIHVVSNISAPREIFFNAHKYLCGLRATKMVAAFLKYDHKHYIENLTAPYTILAPQNEYYDDSVMGREASTYHIIEGKYKVTDLKDNMFVKTELKTKKLLNHRQRTKVSVNPKWESDGVTRVYVRFNGVSVMGEPVEIGNSIIYILSKTLSPPGDVMAFAMREKQLSAFVSAVYASDMLPTVQTSEWVTIFAPTNNAFVKLGLLTSYLLHPDGRDDLRDVVEYHMLNESVYTEDIPQGESSYWTIDGASLKMIRDGDKISVKIANGTATIVQSDVLTSTGVLHVVESVQLPPTLHITLGKILKGIGANTMMELFKIANLSEILDDPMEPFIVLSPTEDAFKKINITKMSSDPELLSRLLRLHIIPATDDLVEGAEFPTLLSNNAKLVVRRNILHGGYDIEVKGYYSLIDRARITGTGRTWNGGAVYEIDKVLLPEHNSAQVGMMFFGLIVGTLLVAVFITTGGGLGYHHYRQYQRRRAGYEPISS
ncbi:1205_t:CDS:2 [Acaulospora colombiana]|uniref:1205_t:CDS:1 n=1 Tax=Acaulospora colombiana TaxID=27376 RepID=A0ACA9LV35_9GLOM|nr:1205_t:CDS:2 [Acaulospora colombiana]